MTKFILLITAALTLSSCNQGKRFNNGENTENKIETETETLADTVTLSAEPNEIKLSALPDTLKVIMVNHTQDTVTTGLHYHIEYYEDNKWTKISPDQFFNDIGFLLTEGDYKTFDIKLLKEQIDYKTGKYRIAKYYLKSDYQATKQTFQIYADFNIG